MPPPLLGRAGYRTHASSRPLGGVAGLVADQVIDDVLNVIPNAVHSGYHDVETGNLYFDAPITRGEPAGDRSPDAGRPASVPIPGVISRSRMTPLSHRLGGRLTCRRTPRRSRLPPLRTA